MVSIQIMGPFASSAFVMCLEVETLDSVVLSVQRDTCERCDSISGYVCYTNSCRTWGRAGS